jgi:hypothetical protein
MYILRIDISLDTFIIYKHYRWEDVVREDSIKVLGTKAWKIKAKDRQFWTQRIEEAKAPYGL